MASILKKKHCMSRMGNRLRLMLVLTVFAVCGCQESDRPNGSPETKEPILHAQNAVPFNLHPLRASVPEGFIRAADVSHCLEIEQHGGRYRNSKGAVSDIMLILAESGINHARIRLWIDPEKNPYHYAGDGNTTTAAAKEIAVRAKGEGLGVMMDFHYSDWWANPGTQQIPFIWKDIPTKQELLDALYNYTKETIEEFTAAGAEPDTVKIGNEITNGFLNEHGGGSAGGMGYILSGWQDYSDALKAASLAVREAAPNAKIVIHLGDGGVGSIVNIFANFTRRSGGQAPVCTEVDYDIIGLSWYPIWQEHLSIDSLFSNIQNLKQTFGKDVLLCETGYNWTSENFDSFGNFTGDFNEEAAYRQLTNSNGFVSDSGVPYAYRLNGMTRYIPPTPENQARVIRAIMDAVVTAGGSGVMWWGADWIAPVNGLRSNAEMGALFDNFGRVLPAMEVLGRLEGADKSKPGAVTGLISSDAAGEAVILNWTSVNSAISSNYQLDRAAAKDGPWTKINDKLTGGTYVDTGLKAETTYYYRIRAFNKNGWGEFSDAAEAATFVFEHETPSGLRVSGTTAATVSLVWNPVTGAASYKLYGAKSITEPGTSAYSPLANITSGAAYTHIGLKNGDTWWYKISAVTVNHGESPKSEAVSIKVGTDVDFKSVINMNSSVLDADFLDPFKASNSSDCSTIMKTDGSNYQIENIYSANDADYLYIALDYGSRPAMWQNDWITVWIDNTNSTEGGAVISGNFRAAQNQSINSEATIEFSFSHRQNAVTPAAVVKNTVWANTGDNLYAPGSGDFVIKYRIPLAGIAGAQKNSALRIFVSHTQGWSNGSRPVVGCVVPADAVTGAYADNSDISINMKNALLYFVK